MLCYQVGTTNAAIACTSGVYRGGVPIPGVMVLTTLSVRSRPSISVWRSHRKQMDSPAAIKSYARCNKVISGGALSRTGGPVVPMPRLTYNCEGP